MVIKRIREKLITKESDGLGEKSFKSSLWVGMIQVGQRFLGLARNIILARILAPDDLGLFGIALLALSALTNFSQTGFAQALIQKKKDPKRYLDTAWTIQIIRGIVLTAVLFLFSSLIAGFFKEPSAEPIIKVLAFSMLIGGFSNIGTIFFRKELRFHKEFIFKMTGSIIDLIVTIVALLVLRNVWALVIGSMAGRMVNLLVSYLIQPYRPKLILKWQQAKELFNFGKWIFGSGLLNFLLTEGDDIVLGRLLGAFSLGFYQMAYRISNFPISQISHLLSQVSFPAYSKIQDQHKRLGQAYLKILKITTFFSFPLSFLIYFLAEDFTVLFLGEKWLSAIPAMQGLALWGLIGSVGATLGPVFQARGRPDISTKIQLAKLIVLGALVYPLTLRYGLMGTVAAVVGSAALTNPIADFILIKFIAIKGREFLKRIFFPALGSAAVGLVLFGLRQGLEIETSFISLFGLAIAGALVYLLVMSIFDRLGWYRVEIKYYFKRFLS